jgi:hypothetical protein
MWNPFKTSRISNRGRKTKVQPVTLPKKREIIMPSGPKQVPLKLRGKIIGEAFISDRGDIAGVVTDASAAVELGFHDVSGISLYVEKKAEDKK